MEFYGVIGANYGDEGKGLVTDWLCRTFRPQRVVRFNGGAQAGHTVTTDSGLRHVFSTYGSGTFAGVTTELTKDVVLNPYAAVKEWGTIKEFADATPKICFDRRSPITTQFEVALNQAIEERRGASRHGSCGLGINETIERHNAMGASANGGRLQATLYDPLKAYEGLSWIRENWLPTRMRRLGFDDAAIKDIQGRYETYVDPYANCLRLAHANVFRPSNVSEGPVVYEGAQGLALDEELGSFPHVTRSNTGMRNILHDIYQKLIALGQEDEQHTLQLFFPTRTYLTRHGAGPLQNEDHAVNVLCGNVHTDETNFTNQWQESLRYAPLHVADTCSRIKADYERNRAFLRTELPKLEVQLSTVITCCDQAPLVKTVDRDLQPTPWSWVLNMFLNNGVGVAATSHGPTARTMQVRDLKLMRALAAGGRPSVTI